MPGLSENDPSSFSNPDDCKIKSIYLKLEVNFDTHILSGIASLNVLKTNNACKNLLLDTRDLKIRNIECNGKVLKYFLADPFKSFGSKLDIELPEESNIPLKVDITYETSKTSTALQWLTPQQTAGKKYPYLFSQCQAIHARSLLPCQDTPSVKMPYTAELTIPSELVALMSAVKKETMKHPDQSEKIVNTFEQKVPIPSYLIALAVGKLEHREIGPRSKVWSEKEMVEKAAFEFSETEAMLSTAEQLCGQYVWGVYDLLVLPPSFPYGGMENPCLTFVTPTLLAGDKSLASVVAHEIAHSWTGNLVTNKNPNHFWLNEGHTVFLERKILGRMKGEPERHFDAIGGWKDLQYQINVFEKEKKDNPLSKLVLDLHDVDPDDAFSTVPYEKGSSLLMYLEQQLGGIEVFEGWLKAYVEKFKHHSITTKEWKDFLYEYFQDKKSILDKVDWDAWFYKPGMPPVQPKFDTSLSEAVVQLSKKWCSALDSDLSSFSADDIKSFSAAQLQEFIALLLLEKTFSEDKLLKLGELYKLHAIENSEIKFRWIRLQLRSKSSAAVQKAFKFVNEQGRMKFVRPLYRDLYEWMEVRQSCIDNFKKHSKSMHILTATMVSKDLKL